MNYNIPKPTFVIETDRLYVGLDTSCLRCGDQFRVEAATLAMTIGPEVLGYFCGRCLTPTMNPTTTEIMVAPPLCIRSRIPAVPLCNWRQ